jgi:hypothetical protein
MTEQPSLEIQCHELVAELLDVCGWLAGSHSTPDEFRRTVAAFEARKLARFGFILSSSLTSDDIVHFSLRTAAGEFCASLDVDPANGEMALQQAWH